jgi:hypothetical protein
MKALKIAFILVSYGIVSTTGIVHAQIASTSQVNSISSTLKSAVNTTKENAAKNSALRNQLVAESPDSVQSKEKNLVDQLNLTLLNLENIQTRIAAKAAEAEASGTDVTLTSLWLATSSSDIITAQNSILTFASSKKTENTIVVRKFADAAIEDVNNVHDDLQSALNALMGVL